jgi:hypothetical protein
VQQAAIQVAKLDAPQDEQLAAPAVLRDEGSQDVQPEPDAQLKTDETHSGAFRSADEPRSEDAAKASPAARHSG